MAQKNNEKDEFDFASFGDDEAFENFADFGDEEHKPSSTKAAARAKPSDEDFGAEDFGSDFGGGDFDASDFDAADPFSDTMPPTPESVDNEAMSGDADKEFGDFESSNDDFLSTPKSKFAQDVNEDFDSPSQFDSSAEGIDDPFADDGLDGGTDTFEDTPSAEDEVKPTAGSSNIVKYAGIAAALVAGVWFGTPYVKSMLGNNTPVETAQITPAPAPSFPSALPSASAQKPAPSATAPTIPATALPAPTMPTSATPSAVQVNPTPVAATPSITIPSSSMPASSALVTAATATPAAAVDDMAGGSNRGGLDQMKAQASSGVSDTDFAALSGKVAAIGTRISSMESQIEAMKPVLDQVSGLLKAQAANGKGATGLPEANAAGSAAVLPTSGNPAAHGTSADSEVTAPLKPPIIEDAVLRGVSRDTAWISFGGKVKEAHVGDTFESAGTIQSFQNYRGRWIAVTDKGIIVAK